MRTRLIVRLIVLACAAPAARHEVYAFNGRGRSATVIDARRGAVATIPLEGKPEDGKGPVLPKDGNCPGFLMNGRGPIRLGGGEGPVLLKDGEGAVLQLGALPWWAGTRWDVPAE